MRVLSFFRRMRIVVPHHDAADGAQIGAVQPKTLQEATATGDVIANFLLPLGNSAEAGTPQRAN
jgi:hypothetical protein